MHVLRSYEELGAWGRREAPDVAVTIGFFDGVHLGHARLFAELRDVAGPAPARTLAVTFSNSPREFHEPEQRWRFLTTPVEKLLRLSRSGLDATLMLRYDRSVASQSAGLFLKGLAHYAPLRAICAGFDSCLGSDMVSGREQFTALCQRLDLRLRFVAPLEAAGSPVKSSRIRALVDEGRLTEANRLLGHPYFVLGSVVHGKGKGARQLDIPTANLILPPDKLVPPVGVYAAWAEVEGRFYPAATCVMTAELWHSTPLEIDATGIPSGLAADQPVIETHLIGFDGHAIYGSTLTLHFLERLRGWQDFAAVPDLQARIARDIEETVAACGRHGLGVESLHANDK